MRTFVTLIVSGLWAFSTFGCAPAAPAAPATDPQAAAGGLMEIAARYVTDDGTTVVELANGMTVIVKPMRTSPVVSVQGYVRTGLLYEGRWLGTGVSHLLEHLVAEGAEHEGQAKAGQKVDRVEAIGGQANAYTTLDHTCYHISALSGKTGACIDLIADWLTHPDISEADFRREHGVVQRELELDKDKPNHEMWELHARALYGTHPAAVPTIGFARPLRELTLADVRAYHAMMYVPQNMIFVVAGDVDVEDSLLGVRKAFAGFARGRNPDLSLPDVKPVAGLVRTVKAMPALKDTMARVSFQTIGLLDPDLHALDVLSDILTNGESSRLVNSLKNQKSLVTAISSGSWTPAWGKGSLTFSFRADPAKAPAAEKALLEELARVVASGVTGDELARAKKQKIAEHVYAQQTVDSVADTAAGDFLSTGDVSFSRNYVAKIQAVTAQQVHAAARKYMTFDRMVVTQLTPGAAQAASGPASRPAAAGAPESTAVFDAPDGTRVILHATNAVGLVSMTYAVKGGLLAEDEKTNGLGTAMAELSLRGAGTRSGDDIAAFFDGAGGEISADCGSNTFYWQATVLADSFAPAMDIFTDVIRRPTFPAKELEALRPQLVAAAARVDEDAQSQLSRFFKQKFYPGKPYGLMPVGTVPVLQALTPEQIRRHHQAYVTSQSGVLAIYGRFDAAKAAAKLKALLAGGKPAGVRWPEGDRRSVMPGGEQYVKTIEKGQAGVMIGLPGMRVTDRKDALAINVLDTIISGYHLPSGWLHTELRGKKLVYVVHAFNSPGLQPGAFVVYAVCQPEKVPEVLAILRANLTKAGGYTPTREEIATAVNTILTADLLGAQSMAELSMQSAVDELYGLGYNYRRGLPEAYRALTGEDILRAAKKYIAGPYVTTVTTPKPELLEKAAK